MDWRDTAAQRAGIWMSTAIARSAIDMPTAYNLLQQEQQVHIVFGTGTRQKEGIWYMPELPPTPTAKAISPHHHPQPTMPSPAAALHVVGCQIAALLVPTAFEASCSSARAYCE